MPTSTTYTANLAPAHMRGRYMSIYSLTWGVAGLAAVSAFVVLAIRAKGRSQGVQAEEEEEKAAEAVAEVEAS